MWYNRGEITKGVICIDLKLGKKYKYNQLCSIFNIKPERGSKQKSQLSSLREKYDIEKNGNVYIVHKEYSKDEIVANVKYGKYKKLIEPMLYTVLSQPNKSVMRVDMHELMEFLGIVNKDYHYAKYHPKECIEQIDKGSVAGLTIFSRESEPLLKRIIVDILKDMQDRCLIKVNMIPMFAKKYIDAKDRKLYTKVWEADKKKDIPRLLEAKREVLKEFKIDYWEDLQYSQFGKAKDIIANKLEIDYFYYEYEIILNKEGLKEFITEDYSTLKKVLNKKIQEKTKASKQGNLKFLTDGEKDVYVEYFISTETDYKLREKKNDERTQD